ncbi:MAG: tetratricopeptide repeat protein [Bacteroidales bacterium]
MKHNNSFVRLFGILFLLSIVYSGSTQADVDNLFANLDTIQNDSAKLSYLNSMAFDNSKKDFQAARLLADSAIKLSKMMKNQSGLSMAYLNKGTSYHYMSEFSEALLYFDSAKMIAELQNDSVMLARAYNNIGLTHRFIGDMDIALINFFQSIKFLKSDTNRIASRLGNIATIYFMQDKYEKAIEVFKEIEIIFKKQGKTRYLISTYNNLSMCYMELDEFSKAKEYSLNALQASIASENIRGQGIAYYSLGRLSNQMKLYSESINYLRKSLEIAKGLNDNDIVMNSNHELGVAYKYLGDFSNAEFYLLESVRFAEKLNAKIQLEGFYNEMSNFYYDARIFEKSYDFLKLKIAITDSLMNEKSKNK